MNWKIICEILLIIILSVTSYVYPVMLSITIPILVVIIGMWLKRIFEKPQVDEEKIGKAVAKGLSMFEEEKKKKAKLSDHYQNLRKLWQSSDSCFGISLDSTPCFIPPIMKF